MSSIIRRVDDEKIISSSCLPRGVHVYATYIIEWCHCFAMASHVSSTKRISRIKSLMNGFPKTWKMRSLGMSWNHTYTHYTTVSFIWWRLWDTMMGSRHIQHAIVCIRSIFINIIYHCFKLWCNLSWFRALKKYQGWKNENKRERITRLVWRTRCRR